MTRIDFYIIDRKDQEERFVFCCKLVAKAFRLGHRVYIQCEDESTADELDRLLWSAHQSSFIPHRKAHACAGEENILIGWKSPPESHFDLCINLSQATPPHYSRFSRLIEVINQAPAVLSSGRLNYRTYKEKNYPLYRHDLRKPALV